MKYKIEITFDSNRKLSGDELLELENNLILQVQEPTDYDSNYSDWKSSNVTLEMQKEIRLGVFSHIEVFEEN